MENYQVLSIFIKKVWVVLFSATLVIVCPLYVKDRLPDS